MTFNHSNNRQMQFSFACKTIQIMSTCETVPCPNIPMDCGMLAAPDEIFQNSNLGKSGVSRSQWNCLCLSTVVKRNPDDLWSEPLNHLNFVLMLKCSMVLAKNCSNRMRWLHLFACYFRCYLPSTELQLNPWQPGHRCAYLSLVGCRVLHVLETPSLYRVISLHRVNSSLELDSKSTLPFVNRKCLNWLNEEGANDIVHVMCYFCYWRFKWQCWQLC